jgi:hypothetical protein
LYGGAVLALTLGLASTGTAVELTAAHSSGSVIPAQRQAPTQTGVVVPELSSVTTALPGQLETSSLAKQNMVIPFDRTTVGGGGGGTYTEVEVPGWVLATAVGSLAAGVLTYITVAVCAGAPPICPAAIAAAGYILLSLVKHFEFPNVYIWWDDTTWSLADVTY